MSLNPNDILLIRDALAEDIRSIIRDEVRPIVKQVIREEVRPIVREEIHAATDTRFTRIEDDIQGIKNDIKGIYGMLTKRGLRKILS